jgi:hypothetical protein
MGPRVVALVTRSVSRSVICAAVFGGIGVLTMFVWFVMVAPPVISFSLAVASAVAWCMWMEGSPEPHGEHWSSQSWVFSQASTPIVRKKEKESS